jgi:hypothetical protein
MTIVFADTAFFVSCLSVRDAHHGMASEFALGFEGRIATTQWVFAEVGNFFASSQKAGGRVRLHATTVRRLSFQDHPGIAGRF